MMRPNAGADNGSDGDAGLVGDDAFVAGQGGVSDLAIREFSAAQLRAAFYRNRFLIGATVCAGVLIGLLLSFFATPIYQATATLQIDQQAPKVFDAQSEDLTGQQTESDAYLPTQVEILKSRAVADEVAKSLGYYGKPTLFTEMGIDPPSAEPGSASWNRSVVSQLQSGLTAEIRPGTRLVGVSFSSPNPALAQTITNKYAEQFITSSLERRFDASAYSRNFLADQIEQTRRQLEDSERELINFAQEAGITDVGSASSSLGGSASTLVGSNLAKLNDEYAAAKAKRILAQQRWEQARTSPTLTLPQVLSDNAVQTLLTQRAQLQTQLEGERDRHGEAYPAVSELKKRIGAINSQISSFAANVRSSIREEYELALKQEQSMGKNVGALQSERIGEQSRGVQLTILRREADTNRALYDALLQRYRELNAAAGVTTNNISIIDRADLPRSPIWPRPMINVAVGALLGLCLGFVLAFLRERFGDSVRSPDDVEEKLGLPVLGVMPLVEGEDPTAELSNPKSSMSEAASTLRSLLQLATRHGAPKRLLVTSSTQSEGKTTTSIAIAREFSHAGHKVLLIDGDLRRPSIHRQFARDNKIGFSNVLVGECPPAAAVKQTEIERLSIVTSGPIPPSPPQLLTQETLERVLSEYGKDYDIVLIDSPPILGLADVVQLSAVVESVLFVLNAESKRISQVKTSLRRLHRANAPVIGVVLTKFDFHSHQYDAYAYYNYYRYDAEQSA